MHHRFTLLALAVASTFVCLPAHGAAGVADLNNEVRVSLGIQNMDYTEYDLNGVTNDGVLDKENGRQALAGLTATFQGTDGFLKNIFVQGDVRRAAGTTKYVGYLQGGAALVPYEFKGMRATTTTYVGKLGYALNFNGGREQITPYVSYGYRTWVRDMTPSPYGYREDYSHSFATIGGKWQVELTPTWSTELDISGGKTVGAKMKLALNGVTYPLGSASTASVELAAVQRLAPHWNLRYSASYAKFKYIESPAIAGAFEPTSETNVMNFALGVAYTF